VSVVRDVSGTRVTWHAVEGKTYRLEANAGLQSDGWSSLGDIVASGSLQEQTDATISGRRFYRVLQVTP